ncbi:retrovirus-related pol polyprotein from transposon TNT 1-94, partial [Tanacetum coccineum]
ERSSEEYLRDLDIEYQERSLLANSNCFIKRRNNFSSQKANENTECYKCGNKGYFTRDCFSKTFEPSYKSLVNNYSSVSKGFQPKFTPKLIQSSSNLNSQADPKFQKDYKAEYKKMKAKLALLEASPSSSQNASLDEGTLKSQPFPESTTIDPKDSMGNKQPIDTRLTSTASDKGTAKTTSRLEGSLGDKDSGETNHPLI